MAVICMLDYILSLSGCALVQGPKKWALRHRMAQLPCTAHQPVIVICAWSRSLDPCDFVLLQAQNGSTALHNAAAGGHAKAVEALVAAPTCDCDVQNSNGNTALHLAASKGQHMY